MKTLLLGVLIGFAAAAGGALATDIGHEAARRLRRDGVILPLGDIVGGITQQWPGRVLDTELEREHGRYVYEIELLGDDGHVYEFEIDAQSGRRLDVEREH